MSGNNASFGEKIKKTFAGCSDFFSRRIRIGGGAVTAELLFIDGLVSGTEVGEQVIKPLTDASRFADVKTPAAARDAILTGAVYEYSAKRRQSAEDVVTDLLNGWCALVFADGAAVTFETKSSEKRSVDQPKEEKVVNGPKDAFIEVLRTNTMLVRRRLRNPDLRLRDVIVGEKSSAKVTAVYIEGFTNSDTVREVIRRLKAINTEDLLSSSVLTENIVDVPSSPFPQVITTERPDKFCTNLLEGRVGILVDGLPMGFLVPATFTQFMKVPEDHSSHFISASVITLLRYLAFVLAAVLPAFYVAIAMYHQEMIPLKLLVSIINAKKSVPFPTAFEVVAMLVAFELLQEAGLRLPAPIGQTVSIIGALIVGQSAVEAKVVSPVVVVVVALSGICGYTMPNQDMGAALRILRFLLTLSAVLAGMFGLTVGLTLLVYHLSRIESYGVPYLYPFAGGEGKYLGRAMLRYSMRKKRNRDPGLRPEDER